MKFPLIKDYYFEQWISQKISVRLLILMQCQLFLKILVGCWFKHLTINGWYFVDMFLVTVQNDAHHVMWQPCLSGKASNTVSVWFNETLVDFWKRNGHIDINECCVIKRFLIHSCPLCEVNTEICTFSSKQTRKNGQKKYKKEEKKYREWIWTNYHQLI